MKNEIAIPIEDLQAAMRVNFSIYADNKVRLLKTLEEQHGKAFVHYGGDIYEDWYYVLGYGIILFGFSSKGDLRNEPPQQLIDTLKIQPCEREQVAAAFDDFLVKWKQKHSQEDIERHTHMFEYMSKEIQTI